jgi:hypothetical protein
MTFLYSVAFLIAFFLSVGACHLLFGRITFGSCARWIISEVRHTGCMANSARVYMRAGEDGRYPVIIDGNEGMCLALSIEDAREVLRRLKELLGDENREIASEGAR